MKTTKLFEPMLISNFPVSLKKKMQERKENEKMSFATQIREAMWAWFENEKKVKRE